MTKWYQQLMKKGEIKIGSLVYIVEEVEHLDNDDDLGCCNWQLQRIQIEKDLSQEMKEVVLIHEIIHAINNQMEEKETEFLAQSIYQVFKENNILK